MLMFNGEIITRYLLPVNGVPTIVDETNDYENIINYVYTLVLDDFKADVQLSKKAIETSDNPEPLIKNTMQALLSKAIPYLDKHGGVGKQFSIELTEDKDDHLFAIFKEC